MVVAKCHDPANRLIDQKPNYKLVPKLVTHRTRIIKGQIRTHASSGLRCQTFHPGKGSEKMDDADFSGKIERISRIFDTKEKSQKFP